MGQRTAFLVKRTYWNGDVNVRLVHHQWGIDRVMHNHFIKDFFEMITYRGFQDKTLKDFMKIIDDEHSLYAERTFKNSNRYQPNVFHKNTIKRYFDKTDNNNGGMIIEIKEKPSDKQPWALDIEDIKIGFVVGDEECQYDYEIEKYIGDKPFERLYTGEEYVKISCNGDYAYPEFLQMWNGFIKQYKIQEITDTEKENEVA
ncbi:MAG: hypothetical protein NC200_03105 [Candidatus Gastranaerophilales bacterium]|nr:hypothetical protein [Candidatus Gastranaerophilales bacterium]